MTAQARTKRELADLLQKKGIPAEAADAVLARFEDVGLIDDEAFAAAWVTSRQQRRHLSRRALRAELTRKGIDRDVIADATGTVDDEDEFRAALDYARSRRRQLAGLEPHVQRRRLQGALARRGFGAGVVAQVTNEVLGGLDDDVDWS